jgi:hypothetical protein
MEQNVNSEELIRTLIKGSIQRAIQECLAAVVVLIAFGAILARIPAGSVNYYGCLTILVGAGFIAGVLWSHALSYRLLQSHAPNDEGFWREIFNSQARLLRLVPFWYCAPICAGGVLLCAPASRADLPPFLIMLAVFAIAFVGITILNRKAADKIDEMAAAWASAINCSRCGSSAARD